ncbi:hypothetical protein ACA910_011927 [Epithemia clementina (nom. ined.)]
MTLASEKTPLLSVFHNNDNNKNDGNNNHDDGKKERPNNKNVTAAIAAASTITTTTTPPTKTTWSPSLWSHLLFAWFTPLLQVGDAKQALDEEDLQLVPLPYDCQTDPVRIAFEQAWQQQQQQQEGSHDPDSSRHGNRRWLIAALWHAFGWDYVKAGVLKLVHDGCLFVGPQVLHALIDYLKTPNASVWTGLAWTAAVTVSQLAMSLCLRHYFFICYQTGLRVRTSIVRAVYQQALQRSSTTSGAPQSWTLGQVTNLVSVDAQRLQELPNYLHALWYSPLQIGLALFFLWRYLGPSSLGGVAVILCTIPCTKLVAQYMGQRQKQLMQAKDARVNINSEVLANMKVIKLQAWEEPFCAKIQQLRQVELQQLWRYLWSMTGIRMIWTFTPLLVALATFAGYVASGHELNVASALTSLTLFSILRFPLTVFPQVINNVVESLVAVQRIQEFLLSPQHEPVPVSDDLQGNVLQMKNVTATYNSNTYTNTNNTAKEMNQDKKETKNNPPTTTTTTTTMTNGNSSSLSSSLAALPLPPPVVCLRDVNFEIRPGELVAVVGGVGCGKSTFLKALLGEVQLLHGTTHFSAHAAAATNNKLAYFAQTPFILNATVRDNILFGHVRHDNDENDNTSIVPYYDDDLYQRALTCCALRPDLDLFPDYDLTEIGEKGLNLSGGQKARIALARAVYHQATITLLDDALSAVDAHVAHELFTQAIAGELLRSRPTPTTTTKAGPGQPNNNNDRCVVLVTNALQHLRHEAVSRIVVLRQGRVVEQGTFAELSQNPHSLFAHFLQVMDDTGVSIHAEPCSATMDVVSSSGTPTSGETQRVSSTGSGHGDTTNNNNVVDNEDSQDVSLLQQEVEQLLRRNSSTRSSCRAEDTMIEEIQRRVSSTRKLKETIYQLGGQDNDGKDDDNDKDKPPSNQQKQPAAAAQKLMTQETRAIGTVSWSVYQAWIYAAGGWVAPVIILLGFTIAQAASVVSGWWLTYWSDHANDDDDDENSGHDQYYFLWIYAWINVAAIVVGFGRMLLTAFIFVRATRNLFERMLTVVVHAPMSFYDTTPVGRLVNRFSQDIYTTDEQLLTTIGTYLLTLFDVFGTLVVISGVTPVFAFCLVPMIMYYVKEQRYFTITYRELKRLDSVYRSPIHALLGETVDGVSTIRAFGAENSLLRRLTKLLDMQQHAYYLTCTAQSWLAVRLETIGTLIITFACLSAIFEHWRSGSDVAFAGLAGLAISYSLQVTQSLNWSARMASDMDANMVAVERIDEYTRLENEAARRTPLDAELKGHWPSQGTIVFKGAQLRYRPGLPLVLKGLDITIPGGSKVGVVGRTGAGKSTLMVALMRIVELSGGRIEIDGQDIRQIGLAMLRRNMAVIPQDPILFSGSIQSNLDPFDEYDTADLYATLQRVGLYAGPPTSSNDAGSTATPTPTTAADTTTSIHLHMDRGIACINSLEDVVSEGGLNFSVGQRQLLVIARALLQGAKIVIMDEATAAVDAETDAAIQKVIRTEFVDATCITVAHRIHTIMDSDWVLVMDKGRAAEFDSPNVLMHNRQGLFRALVQASAKQEKEKS